MIPFSSLFLHLSKLRTRVSLSLNQVNIPTQVLTLPLLVFVLLGATGGMVWAASCFLSASLDAMGVTLAVVLLSAGGWALGATRFVAAFAFNKENK